MNSIGQIQEAEKRSLIKDNDLIIPSIQDQQKVVDALLYDGLRVMHQIMKDGNTEEKIKTFNSLISHSRLMETRRMNTADKNELEFDDENLIMTEDVDA